MRGPKKLKEWSAIDRNNIHSWRWGRLIWINEFLAKSRYGNDSSGYIKPIHFVISLDLKGGGHGIIKGYNFETMS